MDNYTYNDCINDRFNPFRNDTEFKDYNQDYRKIVPQIAMKNCVIPEKPSAYEKKKIRHYFNAVGFFMTGQILIVNVLAVIFTIISQIIIAAADGGTAYSAGYADIIMNKMNNSSLNMAITGLSYMTANLIIFMAGCKATKIDRSSLFQTKDLTAGLMLKYSVIAIFLQMSCALFASLAVSPIIDNIFGVDIYEMLDDTPTTQSITKIIAVVLYTCIIAPVTEELVLRGFVLKNLSRVSQRFGIFTSALIFALMHENIPQFILAFVVGTFLGYVAVKHNSIIPTIILHIIVNSTNTIISLIAEGNEMIGNIIYAVWTIGFIIAGLALLIYSIAKKQIKMPRSVQAQKNRGIPIMFTSVGMIILIVVHVSLTFIYM